MSKKDIKEQRKAIKELKETIKKEFVTPIEKLFIKYKDYINIFLILIIIIIFSVTTNMIIGDLKWLIYTKYRKDIKIYKI